ncbi:MAG: 4Fe-4S dicluster domain-containing protein [Planctomycetota bacterium]|nr:4Fe-4S dicluster domain-containing protein [Planctomycetota bacterium]
MGAAIIVLSAMTLCLFSIPGAIAGILSWVPAPSLVGALTTGSAFRAGAALALFFCTFMFGRFFCSFLCPLGTSQDIIALLVPERQSRVPNLRLLRYGVLFLSLALLAGGWALAFGILDPFSRFGALAAAAGRGADASAFGLAAPPALALLVVWKRRLFCVSLCPVGTLLGLLSRHGVYGMRITGACTRCGLCERRCPTSCIESAGRSLDNERCLLCLNCLSACPGRSIAYTRRSSPPPPEPGGVSRRGFLLVSAAAGIGALGVGRGLAGAVRALALTAENMEGAVLPPGALKAELFVGRCTGCRICSLHCPPGIIKASPLGFAPVRLDYSQSGCAYECTACNGVCPSGALRPLALADKQWLKIGEAEYERDKCRVVRYGEPCGACARACPKGAIFLEDGPNGLRIPVVAAYHCIGCGACRAACPGRPKAMAVKPIEQRPMGS